MSASEDSALEAAGPGRRGRVTSTDSVRLALGSAASGLLAYVFFMLASRSLGAAVAAPVSVLWSYWAISAAVLTFPVQHWLVRRFTVDGVDADVARALGTFTAVVGALSVGAGLLAFLTREQLFGLNGAAFPVMVTGTTLGSFFIGVVRGCLSGCGRFGSTALSLAGENGLRVAAAGVVMWAEGGPVAFGVALVLGPAFAVVWLPTLRLGRGPGGPARAGVRESLSLLSGVVGGSLIAQLVLTGGPVVLAVIGGAPAEVTALFLALSVWRAPYIVAMGVTPQLTAALTRLVRAGPPRRVLRVTRLTVVLVVLGAALAALLGATVLQPLLRVAFGADVRLDELALIGLGIGTVLALGNLVLLLVLLAQGRSRFTTLAWVVALAVSGCLLLVEQEASPLWRVVVAFLTAEVVAFALHEVAIERSAARHDSPPPGAAPIV